MTGPIHQHLDGDDGAPLSPGERARASELARTLDAAAAHLRAMPAPDLAARVMAALPKQAPAPRPAWRAALDWLWNPRPVRLTVRPAFALAGGCMAVAVAALALDQVDDRGTTTVPVVVQAPAPGATGAPVVYVQFRLEAGNARQVSLAGTFTGWQPTLTLEEKEPGVWTALVPLKPGVHDYVFVVDGTRWIPDPNAPQQVDDSFGGTNSRISLPALSAQA
ncbi:glycogen-binding domain-containing protein [Longimicrobium sp.]|uniref:glycogen-binding domain-containing protein n=1 Tax=Longimicrobium sp. TaxID=2029185 RepID=UPI002E2F8A0D|nr:glycogen-binding domain-containing protein [Longimicrobium sp.]HEX6041816.1 glycogen-binding domain-containing protein [Longimicrobium sp.]